jgi:hypothetical protein
LSSAVKSLPSHDTVRNLDSSSRYHTIRDAASTFSVDLEILKQENNVSERFEGFEFPRSKANNIPVVAFILEPIIVPVLERKDTTLAEKAACDLFMRPHLAYFKHTVQKARNLPKDCDVVIKTLDFALEKESSKLVMCGEIELGGANSLIILR